MICYNLLNVIYILSFMEFAPLTGPEVQPLIAEKINETLAGVLISTERVMVITDAKGCVTKVLAILPAIKDKA